MTKNVKLVLKDIILKKIQKTAIKKQMKDFILIQTKKFFLNVIKIAKLVIKLMKGKIFIIV